MSAADLGTLMDARAAVMEATKDEPLGDVFNDVCGSHQDYIWNVAMQAP